MIIYLSTSNKHSIKFSDFACFLQSDKEHEKKITEQREKQRELIQQLKSQLEDLENYAYEVGI
jgi:hypothetical protein